MLVLKKNVGAIVKNISPVIVTSISFASTVRGRTFTTNTSTSDLPLIFVRRFTNPQPKAMSILPPPTARTLGFASLLCLMSRSPLWHRSKKSSLYRTIPTTEHKHSKKQLQQNRRTKNFSLHLGLPHPANTPLSVLNASKMFSSIANSLKFHPAFILSSITDLASSVSVFGKNYFFHN